MFAFICKFLLRNWMLFGYANKSRRYVCVGLITPLSFWLPVTLTIQEIKPREPTLLFAGL
jgi:hypothetical protein